jgi:superfamily II DNA or RNA helicase
MREKMRAGVRRIALVAPTGAGKTTIAGAMIHGVCAKGRRAIFLAHRKELINQCADRLTGFGIPHGVIKAKDKRYDPYKPVQVASIQTLINREHWDADLIVVDECHRSTSPTYQKIIDRYSNPYVVGLTATPYRMDGRGLGEVYDDLHEVIPTRNLIDMGFLINPQVFGTADPIDLSPVTTAMGDYNKRELADAMGSHILRGEIISNWSQTVMKKSGKLDACTVVFAPSVEQSILIVEQFKEIGVAAAHVDGKTPDSERDEILAKLRARELTVVSNWGILTEGWDLPHLECVILARPTRSRSLYKQMVGRLMRPDPGKRFAFVLDHGNCTQNHGFVDDPEEFSLEGREKRPRKGSKPAPHKQCENCLAMLPLKIRICPVCGHEKLKTPIEYTDEFLVELDRKNLKKRHPKAAEVPPEERQRVFNHFCHECMERGYKPNQARVRYLQTYGEWPSWQSGIRTPRSFAQYESAYKKRKEAEAEALRASLGH